jgi:uncharacterized protein YndB with AHSA1/START domain
MTNTTPAQVPPVRKQVTVKAPRAHVFDVFINGIDRWWPRMHHIGKTPVTKFIIEACEGGRWYATHEDGTETNTGRVLVWNPPKRVVLSWQLKVDWSYDPDFMTEVEVTFEEQGQATTLVTLEHRDLERYGDGAEQLRKGIDSPDGWGMIMTRFAEEAART